MTKRRNMRQLNDTRGKIEIVLTTAMLMFGGALLQAQTPHDTSYTASFSCAGYDGCPSSGLVKLKFTPKWGSHLERWQTWMTATNPGNPSAKMIGTVTNVDAVRFPPLDLAVGASAGIFVGQLVPTNERGFGIYKLDSNNHRVGSAWAPKTAAEITYCEPLQPTPTPGGRSKAAIHMKDTAHEMGWNCGPLAAAANAQSSSSNNHSMSLVSMPRRAQGISHLWISCSGGCCDIGAM